MRKANSIIFIAGNGFDLALGYDSGYTHFVNTIVGSVSNYFWPFKQPDDSEFKAESLHQYLLTIISLTVMMMEILGG